MRPPRELDLSGNHQLDAHAVLVLQRLAVAMPSLRVLKAGPTASREPFVGRLSAARLETLSLESCSVVGLHLPATLRELHLERGLDVTLEALHGLTTSLTALTITSSSVTLPAPNLPTSLTSLDVSCCSPLPLTLGLDKMTRLAELKLGTCGLRGFPGDLPPSLMSLDLARNSLGAYGLRGDLTMLSQLQQLDLTSAGLEELPALPPTVTTLLLSEVPRVGSRSDLQLPPALRVLSLISCRVQRLPALPPTLEDLAISLNSGLAVGDELLALTRLQRLNISCCKLSALPPLPPGLVKLVARFNGGMQVEGRLPAALRELDLNNCELRALPALPQTLERLNIGRNGSLSPFEAPPRLRFVNATQNQWSAGDVEWLTEAGVEVQLEGF